MQDVLTPKTGLGQHVNRVQVGLRQARGLARQTLHLVLHGHGLLLQQHLGGRVLQGVVQRLQAGGGGGDGQVVGEGGRGQGELRLGQDVDGGVARRGEGAGVGVALVRLQLRHDLMVADGDVAAVVRDTAAGVIADHDVAGPVLAEGDAAGRLLMLFLAPLDDAEVAGGGDVHVLQQLLLVYMMRISVARVLQGGR